MADGGGGMQARTVRSIHDIDAAAWSELTQASCYTPFADYRFFSALEDSGSATPETGWAPAHLILEDAAGDLIGAAPMYLKSHSYGEYVFDHAWADAYQRAGGRYYPKLQISAPFTPATGPRLLAVDEAQRRRLAAAAAQAAAQMGVSSLHATFLTSPDRQAFAEAGYLERIDQQFHWRNQGYDNFEGFLDALASRKRKTLRKERAAALEDGLTVQWVSGGDIQERHWDAFWEFYQDTGLRKWGQPYLTRAFFSLIGERMAERAALVFALRGDRPIAGALNFIGGDTLYGRYWGCSEPVRFLHFEICYYQAIDFAIAHGLARVEAGAQGEHKLARGYEPTPTYSAHWIADSGFRDAVARYLESERRHVGDGIEVLKTYAPFRKDRPGEEPCE